MVAIIKALNNREARKSFYLEGNAVKQKDIRFPYQWETIETISEEQLAQDNALDIVKNHLLHWEDKAIDVTLARNAPEVGTIFEKTNLNVGDSSSLLFCIDVDWKEGSGFESLPSLDAPLEVKWKYVCEELSLPPCGAILKCSSSGYVELGYNKLCLQAFVILDRPLDEAGLKDAFSSILCPHTGIDPAMCKQAQVCFIQKPNKTQEVNWLDRPSTIVKIDGDPLDVSLLPQDNKRIRRYKNKNRYLQLVGDNQTSLLQLIERRCGGNKKKANQILTCWKKIEETTLSIAKEGGLDATRNRTLYDLIKLSYNLNGSTTKAKEFILNNDEIIGERSEKDIHGKIEHFHKNNGREIWNCGDVAKSFKPEDIKQVSTLDLKDLGDDLIEDLPKEGVLLLKSGCGSGKTSGVIKRMIKEFDTVLAVTHRQAILEGMCPEEKLNLTYYLHSGQDRVDTKIWESLSERDRKKNFCHQEERLAITINSLEYVLKDGAIHKPFDVVVIDEVEQVLDYFFVEDKIANNVSTYRQLSKTLQALLMFCEKAKLVIVADDSASHDITGWFTQLIATNADMRRTLLLNDKDYVEEMMFYMIDSEYEMIWSICDRLLNDKKIHIFVDDSDKDRQLERLCRIIRSLTGLGEDEVMWFDRSSFDDDKFSNNTLRANPDKVIPELFDNGLRCLITSPFIDCGWSYERPEPEYIFDECMVLLKYKFTHHQKIKSLLRRDRFTSTHRVWTRWGYIPDFSKSEYIEWDDKGRLADPLEALDRQLKQGRRKRQENIRIAFETEIKALDGDVRRNNILFTEENRMFLQEVNRQSEFKELNEEVLDAIRQDTQLAYKFVDSTEFEIPNYLEGSESLLRQCKKFKDKDIENILNLWEMDTESRRDLSIGDHNVWELKGKLLDSVGQVISSAFGVDEPKDNYRAFYEWMTDPTQKEIVIFLWDTPEIDAFRKFVDDNHIALKDDVLFGLGAEGKNKSPLQILKLFCEAVFLDGKKVTESKAFRPKDKRKPAVKERLFKHYGFKKSESDRFKRYESLKRLKGKLNTGERVSWREEEIVPFYDRFVITKRQYMSKQLIEHIKEVIDND